MNQDILKNGGIDYDAGVSRFRGDAGLYEKVLRVFARDDVALRARAAYDRHDMTGLFAAVHEAKGTSGNMELHEAYELACQLVTMLRSGDCAAEKLSGVFLEFERSYLYAQACVRQAAES